MRILVLGAGAVGGYFGGRLAQASADVTFLVRSRRREQLSRDGLRITSPLGDVRLKVQTVLSADLKPGYDLVLLACKAYDLASAMDAIAPVMSGECAVLPVLNGMAHLTELDRRLGAANVMAGTCMIDAALQSDGTIVHGGSLQRLVFGERDGSRSLRAKRFAAACTTSMIDWQLDDDIMQRLWDKLVFLSALAATTCLFRANVREIVAAPGGRAAMERALAANVAIAEREGHPVSESAIAIARDRLTDATGTWSASLLRDLEAGGKIEGDHIVGWMLARARQHAIDDVILSLAYTALRAYEVRRDTRGSR